MQLMGKFPCKSHKLLLPLLNLQQQTREQKKEAGYLRRDGCAALAQGSVWQSVGILYYFHRGRVLSLNGMKKNFTSGRRCSPRVRATRPTLEKLLVHYWDSQEGQRMLHVIRKGVLYSLPDLCPNLSLKGTDFANTIASI
jgi:hypothetical protein